MPIHSGHNSKGMYYQWGHQHKYYGRDAKGRATKQGIAIKISELKNHR